MLTMHVGFDDTDSPRMGCTTYIAAILIEKLHNLGVSFIDYPHLVRLNPNVPWKTRGNGALCLRFKCAESIVEDIIEQVIDVVEAHSDMEHAGTEPGIVFLMCKEVPDEIRFFARRTIQGIVKKSEAMRLIGMFRAEAIGFKTGRGIIGALAAIGENLEKDHTYELIAYRVSQNCGFPRKLDESSVLKMNEKTVPLTFNNVDPETGRVLITPRGPDPILYGIRGETPSVVKEAHEMIRSSELIERWVIFRTNHGTDAHLRKVNSIANVQPYQPAIVHGMVSQQPHNVPRRHVIFSIKDKNSVIDCAAYAPTGTLQKVARKLIVGDLVEAYGGVRRASEKHPITINLEKLKILKLAPKTAFHNPLCPQCGRRMKSMGTHKGFRCDKCGFRSLKLTKIKAKEKRNVEEELYITSPRSQRHLTKPLCRYGHEKISKPETMIKDWHSP
ncbi:MAG: tRNA(Ile)(2)-agmatinylcytidine synthase [Candidatus Bathyarchaeota archaeon]|jgi:tRNA(Ile2)-agmatinylcytidine synthase